MNGQRNGLVTALLCSAVLGCADEPQPIESVVVRRISEPRIEAEAEPISAEAAPPQELSDAEVVVYFGSFRDRLAAAKYRQHLHAMGLLNVNITRAQAGVEMLVTEPMDPIAAEELAESLGGRVLSLEWLHRTTRDYGLLPQ